MKKRILSFALAICMAFGSAAALPQGAFTDSASITASAEVSGDYEYKVLDDGTAEITKYKGSEIKVTIPSTIDGKKVTSIGSSAFSDCTSLTSVTIPSGVKSIGDYAFFYCSSLTSIIIPNGVASIGSSAFYNCTSLTSVTIPSSVTSIGYRAFYDCENLSSVTIPSSVNSIGGIAFHRTKWLEEQQNKTPFVVVNGILIDATKCSGSVTIPSSVKYIGDNAFDSNPNITSVTIPSSVKSIGSNAFNSCTSLASITIPSSITSFGGRAFYKTEWLEEQQNKNPFVVVNGILIDATKCSGSVTIPSSVKCIGDDAFYLNSSITSVTIPSGVKSIGEFAFFSCIALESISIPSGVTSIGAYAFDLCSSLTNVNIPSSITFIDRGVFFGCENLKSVNIPDSVTSIGDSAFYFCASLASVTIPDSVTSIGSSAFYGCASLASVTIPNSVTSIGEYAFCFCESLTSVTIPNSVTSIGDSAFSGCENLTSITIPRSVTSIGGYAFPYNTKIYCYLNSYAHKFAEDKWYNYELLDDDSVKLTRLAGGNRYGTAGEISKAMFDNKTDATKTSTVVLANGLVAADALAGVPLATKLGAPILLTTTDKVPDETMAEIKRLGAKKVVILGGTGAISEKVEKTLKDNGLTVERLAGKTRFETAAKIADKLQTETKKAPTEAFFVYYNSYADALSASTVAAIKEAPIFYVTTDGKLDDATKAQLDKIKSSITKAYVIGGTGVISENMKKNISTALGNKTVERVSGGNRYSTCVEVNNKFKSVLTGKAICVAKGLDFPDALAGGVFAAQNKAPLFLADNKLQDVQTEYLKSKKADSIYIFGGTGAVPDSLVQSIAQASI